MEMTLSEYLLSSLSNFASFLGIEDASSTWFDSIENEVAELLPDETSQVTIHALAKMLMWQKVLVDVSMQYSYSTEGESFSRSQVYSMVEKNYEKAVSDYQQFNQPTVDTVNFGNF